MRINFTFSCIAAYALVAEQKTLVDAIRLQSLSPDSEPSEESPDAQFLPEADIKTSATVDTDAGTKVDAKTDTDADQFVLYRPLDTSLGGLATHVYESIFGPSLPPPVPLLPPPVPYGYPSPMPYSDPGYMQPQKQPLVNVYAAPQTMNPQYYLPPSPAYQSPFQQPEKVIQPVVIQNQCPQCKPQQPASPPIKINVNYEKGSKTSQISKDDPFEDEFFKEDSAVKPAASQPVSLSPLQQPQPQKKQTLGPLNTNPVLKSEQQEPAQIDAERIEGEIQEGTRGTGQPTVTQQNQSEDMQTPEQVVQRPLEPGRTTGGAEKKMNGAHQDVDFYDKEP